MRIYRKVISLAPVITFIFYVCRFFRKGGVLAEMRGESAKAFGSLEGTKIAGFAKSLRGLTDGADGSKDAVSATRLVGKFGLAYALARMTLPQSLGVTISNEKLQIARGEMGVMSLADSLFTEVCYEVLIISRESVDELRARWTKNGGTGSSLPSSLHQIGTVGGTSFKIETAATSNGAGFQIEATVLREKYETGWTTAFQSLPARG